MHFLKRAKRLRHNQTPPPNLGNARKKVFSLTMSSLTAPLPSCLPLLCFCAVLWKSYDPSRCLLIFFTLCNIHHLVYSLMKVWKVVSGTVWFLWWSRVWRRRRRRRSPSYLGTPAVQQQRYRRQAADHQIHRTNTIAIAPPSSAHTSPPHQDRNLCTSVIVLWLTLKPKHFNQHHRHRFQTI